MNCTTERLKVRTTARLQDRKTARPQDRTTARPHDRKTARPHDRTTARQKVMYISQILEYLIWPGFILIAWLTVKVALSAYEKKFQEKE